VEPEAGPTIITSSRTGFFAFDFAAFVSGAAACTAPFRSACKASFTDSVTSFPPRRWPIFPVRQSFSQIQELSMNT